MEFLEQLRKLKLYKPDMDILDIGCRNGFLWGKLQKPGRRYDGIDTVDMLDDKTGIHFQRISFADFVPDKHYDLIFARNVFFFHTDQIGQAKRYLQYLKPGGIMCVSFMIDDDPHVGRMGIDGTTWYGVPIDTIQGFAAGRKVLWVDDFKGQAAHFGNIKVEWHMYQMIIKK